MVKKILTRIMYVLMMVVGLIVGMIVAMILPGWVVWAIVGLWGLVYISEPFIKWLVGRDQ